MERIMAASGIDVSATDTRCTHKRFGERIRVQAVGGNWAAGIFSIAGPLAYAGQLAQHTLRDVVFLCHASELDETVRPTAKDQGRANHKRQRWRWTAGERAGVYF